MLDALQMKAVIQQWQQQWDALVFLPVLTGKGFLLKRAELTEMMVLNDGTDWNHLVWWLRRGWLRLFGHVKCPRKQSKKKTFFRGFFKISMCSMKKNFAEKWKLNFLTDLLTSFKICSRFYFANSLR